MKQLLQFILFIYLGFLIGCLCGKIYLLEKEKNELKNELNIYKETVKEYQNNQFIPVEILYEFYPIPKEKKEK